jgi:hypothetical protein
VQGLEDDMAATRMALLASLLALGACQKVGTELVCGADTFKVDFGDRAATVTSSDGSSANLARLEQPAAAGTATVYTNGLMTFTRLETPGAAPVIKFARGKMAFQECRMAAS